jgi:citrate lyase subunit beta/citryl-CoA lyase
MTPMRTHLFVPAQRANMVEKAATIPADVIVLDLEDAVPPNEKAGARDSLRASIDALKAAGKTVHVRINHLDTGLTRDDLSAAIGPGLDGLLFPKAQGAAQIRELDVMIRERELHGGVRPGTIVLIPMLETARAILRCEEIALASTRIAALGLGGEDYAADLGVPRTNEANEFEYARRVIVHCAVAYGLQPLDAIYATLHDEAGLVADARYARSIGMKGKYLVHPDQVAPVNEVFAPTPQELASARKIVDAYDAAMQGGIGVIDVDGQLVDVPVANRARDLLAYAEAIGLQV